MRTTSKFLALALMATMQSAMAGAVFLNFEDLASTAQLPASYNGVNVGGAAWGARSEAGVCNGDFSFIRTNSCGALWLAKQPDVANTNKGESLTLSLADGFIDALSFVFSASDRTSTLAVHVYDAAGVELGKGLDGLTGTGGGSYTFSNWSNTISLTFTGVARSVTFSALDQAFLLDDLRFTTPAANGRLPEPTSIALVLGALGALGWARKRAAR